MSISMNYFKNISENYFFIFISQITYNCPTVLHFLFYLLPLFIVSGGYKKEILLFLLRDPFLNDAAE